jgi:hypothetical protein
LFPAVADQRSSMGFHPAPSRTEVSREETPSDDRIGFQCLFNRGFNFHYRQIFLSETLRGHLIVNGFAHFREMPDQKLQDRAAMGGGAKYKGPPLIPQRGPLARGIGVQPSARDAANIW